MYRLSGISFWKVLTPLVFLVFLSPVVIVLFSLFGEYSENWNHLYNFVLIDYITNSLILVTGVSLITLFIGTGTAWLITNFNFHGKRFFEWALILALAIPPYILAYTFTGLFDSYGTLNNLSRDLFQLGDGVNIFPNVRNIYGAVVVFSFTLYPYVYLVSRSAFINQSRSMLESGRMLGLSQFGIFYKLSLPLIRPAMIGGVMLVVMETLSDFGAVEHFAVQTFTTGIFRTWYGMGDLNTAMQLASMLLIFVGVFLFIERKSRKQAAFTTNASNFRPIQIDQLSGVYSVLAFIACSDRLSASYFRIISLGDKL